MGYTMNKTLGTADIATMNITSWLMSLSITKSVENVENNALYQKKDIDLLWTKTNNKIITIEIKGDRYNNTGNYFFETISNSTKNTLGCFLYTEAKYLFYYFIYTRELHILNVELVRNWFVSNMEIFEKSFPYTKNTYGELLYYSEGRKVPIHMVKRSIGVTQILTI